MLLVSTKKYDLLVTSHINVAFRIMVFVVFRSKKSFGIGGRNIEPKPAPASRLKDIISADARVLQPSLHRRDGLVTRGEMCMDLLSAPMLAVMFGIWIRHSHEMVVAIVEIGLG